LSRGQVSAVGRAPRYSREVPSPGTRAPVAVAIVSWNTRDLLARCLESLAPEVDAGRAEAWVVDNASSDGSADLVRRAYPWAELIASGRNLGFGAAVNLVAARTSTEWLALANADVELTPGALPAMLSAGQRDPAAGAVAPRLISCDGQVQHSVHSFPTLRFTALSTVGAYRLSHRLGERMCLEGLWDPSRPRVVDWALGAFLLVRRASWDDVGGFDEGQWMYAEDLDLGWRLALAGWHTRYEPSAMVRHRGEAATGQLWDGQITERWMDSTYRWMRSRRGRLLSGAVAALNVAGALARWALLVPLPHRREARAALTRWARLHWNAGLSKAASDPDRSASGP
jgi:N-acetylglucosaminyl-diphospho-decaprenol L-rhamnosyltransferase